MSVTVRLDDEIDLGRGDMLVSPENGPIVAKQFRAMVVWLHETPLEVGRTYLVKHTSRLTKLRAHEIRHRVNVNTLENENAAALNMNDIASVEFEAHIPLFFDPYASNRTTGSFILIDALSNATVGAGMIEEDLPDRHEQKALKQASPEIAEDRVRAEERYQRQGHYPATFLLANQPALASRLERALFEQEFLVLHLDEASLGAISIYSGGLLDTDTKHRLANQVNARLLDLSWANESANDEEVFQRVLALADSLRFAKPQNREGAS
jgi:bifunctional enzyme CysN/CysC